MQYLSRESVMFCLPIQTWRQMLCVNKTLSNDTNWWSSHNNFLQYKFHFHYFQSWVMIYMMWLGRKWTSAIYIVHHDESTSVVEMRAFETWLFWRYCRIVRCIHYIDENVEILRFFGVCVHVQMAINIKGLSGWNENCDCEWKFLWFCQLNVVINSHASAYDVNVDI